MANRQIGWSQESNLLWQISALLTRLTQVTAANSGGLTGLTSVGLTMPLAFDVANSPLTVDGILAVTANGFASQYIRGDGQLASFPDIAGGGGGQVFYLNGGTSQGTISGTPYYQLSVAADLGANVDFTSGNVDNVAFADFITDPGKPTQETIPAGVWIFQCYISQNNTDAPSSVYATVEVYDGATFTVISTSLAEVITGGVGIDLYTFTCAVPEYTPLVPADRVAIRFYATDLGTGRTVTLHTQANHLSSIQTTFTTGLAALNGLTTAAQLLAAGTSGTDFNISSLTNTHTFNIPTASASARGLLSSADWTSFNTKQLETFALAASDETTALTVGTAKVTFRMPYAFTLTAVRISCTTAPTGAALIVNIKEGGTTIFSTLIRIDAGAKTSVGSAVPYVLSDTALANDAEITVDITQVGSTVAGTGLKVYLIGRQ
jgi:hypothetical protein